MKRRIEGTKAFGDEMPKYGRYYNEYVWKED